MPVSACVPVLGMQQLLFEQASASKVAAGRLLCFSCSLPAREIVQTCGLRHLSRAGAGGGLDEGIAVAEGQASTGVFSSVTRRHAVQQLSKGSSTASGVAEAMPHCVMDQGCCFCFSDS